MSESARQDTPEQAEFRQYCREWLQNNKPGEPPVQVAPVPAGDYDRRTTRLSAGLAEVRL